MPKTQVTLPNGQKAYINHPEGASEDQILGYAKQQFDAGAFDNERLTMPEEPYQETAGDYLRALGQGLSFGTGDEIEAYVKSFSKGTSYQDELAKVRGEMKQFEEVSPYASLGTELVGSLATPGGLLKIPGMVGKLKQASTLGKIGRAGVTGAATGGLYGAGKSEAEIGSSQFATDVMESAAGGGLFGAGAQATFQTIGGISKTANALAKRAQNKPSVDSVRNLKNQAYKEFDKVAEVADPDIILPNLSSAAKQAAAARQFRPNLNPETNKVLRELDDIVARKESYTVSNLDELRSELYQVANKAGGKDGIIVRDIAHVVDNYIDDIISRSPNVAPDTAKAARELNKQYMKMKMLDEAFTKASHGKAPTHVAYKTAVSNILKNPSRLRFFTDEEIAAMDKFVKGGAGQRVAEYVARYSPGSNSLAALLQLTHVALNPKMAALTAASSASQIGADIATSKGAKELVELMGGYKPPEVPSRVIPQAPFGLLGAEYSEQNR